MAGFRRLRVALATDSDEPSGVGEHMLALGRELAHGHEVILCFPASSTNGSAFLSRAASAGLGAKDLPDESTAQSEWLRQAGIDLLHVHAGIGWEGHGLAQAAQAAGTPVVRTEHLPNVITDPDQYAAHVAGLALVERVITVSEAAAATFRDARPDAEKFTAIRNGIHAPAPKIARTDTRESLGLAEDDQVLITVARFTAQKGHSVLINALPAVLAKYPFVRLLLVGDGEKLPAIEAQADALGISDRVTFLGTRNDVANLLAAADLFVLPSLFEGLPLALLEAMALALPVVATGIGGNVEALGPEHPWYATPGDAADLAEAICAALARPEVAVEVGQAARHRFEAEFHAARMGHETAAIYRDILQTSRATPGKTDRMQKTRIGFIGAGGIAQRHLGVLEGFEDVELAAFADTDFGRAEECARRFGARAFDDHGKMLDEVELDAIYICVPPFAHGAPEQDVIARKLPFFVEKPLSLDLLLAESIAEEVRRSGVITAVGYHWRYLDTVEEAKRLLADNPAQLMSGYWLDSTPPPQWWWKQDRSGGQMVEQATHIIDLARYLAGDVTQVFGMAGHSDRAQFEGLDVATASTASLRFASGAIANLSATCLLNWSHRVGLHVFAGGLAMELTDRELMVDVGAGRPVRHAEGDPVWREDRDFVDAVRGGENHIRCPYNEALETHRVALSVARSAMSGKPVSLNTNIAEALYA